MILGPDGKPLLARPGADALADVVDTPMKRDVSITRSFAFKLNLGNYESADFFCSQKTDCAPEAADSVSADLYEFCVDEVMKSVKDLKERRARNESARAQRIAS